MLPMNHGGSTSEEDKVMTVITPIHLHVTFSKTVL